MRDGWTCECDWKDWFLCWKQKDPELHAIPIEVPIKEIPDQDGIYLVRVFDGDDYNEEESEFSLTKKNWGGITNQAISHWKIAYDDNWTGYVGVYAWKQKKENE